MLSNSDTARPRPPAKARKSTASQQTKETIVAATPPPAYGSPFTFPSRNGGLDVRRDILGSPMESTFKMLGWDHAAAAANIDSIPEGAVAVPAGKTPAAEVEEEDKQCMGEKSREELHELLFRADGIIKERENELGLASTVVKNLYENNVALKSKHQALLARIPMSPAGSTSSPDHLSRSSRNSTLNLSYSTSDGALAHPLGGRTRKVSIAIADISLLADQNAELLGKLQQLEEDATTADLAGRRELKKLEKEISFLREALEKTQAKSEELEEKVQDAVVGEALRRKQEREAKFKAMRNGGRDIKEEEAGVLDFAPGSSKLGGPSDAVSFPVGESSTGPVPFPSGSSGDEVLKVPLGIPEQSLIAQLLSKVKELEQTNTRILQQQSETTHQLSAVQRDAMNITKVYEILADHDSVELELEGDDIPIEDPTSRPERDIVEPHTIRFRSLRRDIENSLSTDGASMIYPEASHSSKNRKSVMGLFDDGAGGSTRDASAGQRRPEGSLLSWSESREHMSWASSLSSAGGLSSPLPSGSLSPLHFFSPLSQTPSELPQGPTLQNELENEFGSGSAASWGMRGQPAHLRTSSLYDLSQISVPPSPSPVSRVESRRASDELEFHSLPKREGSGSGSGSNSGAITPLPMSANTLRLSVEPPTPDDKEKGHAKGQLSYSQYIHLPASYSEDRDAPSPRLQLISQTLRSRKNRWVERRLSRDRGEDMMSAFGFPAGSSSGGGIEKPRKKLKSKTGATKISKAKANAKRPGLSKHLSNAVDNMIENFQTLSSGGANASATLSAAEDTDVHEADDDDDSDDDADWAIVDHAPASRSTTPQPRRIRSDDAILLRAGSATPADGAKKDVNANGNTSLLLQAWLWFQFAIVIFVFLFAMAKRGPGAVLVAEDPGANRKAVIRSSRK